MLGDCASITNHHTGRPYPPTAQHAIRQGKVAAENIILAVVCVLLLDKERRETKIR